MEQIFTKHISRERQFLTTKMISMMMIMILMMMMISMMMMIHLEMYLYDVKSVNPCHVRMRSINSRCLNGMVVDNSYLGTDRQVVKVT